MQLCIHYGDKLPFSTKHSDFCLMYATTSANIHRNYLQWPVKIVGVCWNRKYLSFILLLRAPCHVTQGGDIRWCADNECLGPGLYVHNVNLSQSQLNVNVTLIAPMPHLTQGHLSCDLWCPHHHRMARLRCQAPGEINIPPGVTFYHSPVAYPCLAGN